MHFYWTDKFHLDFFCSPSSSSRIIQSVEPPLHEGNTYPHIFCPVGSCQRAPVIFWDEMFSNSVTDDLFPPFFYCARSTLSLALSFGSLTRFFTSFEEEDIIYHVIFSPSSVHRRESVTYARDWKEKKIPSFGMCSQSWDEAIKSWPSCDWEVIASLG